jgi:hypothetical protein
MLGVVGGVRRNPAPIPIVVLSDNLQGVMAWCEVRLKVNKETRRMNLQSEHMFR